MYRNYFITWNIWTLNYHVIERATSKLVFCGTYNECINLLDNVLHAKKIGV